MKTRTKIIIVLPLLLLLIGGGVLYKLVTEPLNMRFSTSSTSSGRLVKNYKRCWSINRTGLDESNFSGSGSLVLDHLKALHSKMGPDLLVVNGLPGNVWHLKGRHLRHLCLKYDGMTLTHHNRKKDRLCALRRYFAGAPLRAEDVDTSQIYAESQKMDELGIAYINPLPYNWAAQWSYVGELLALFDKTDCTKIHLHFHCEHGKGRTTTMMALYDIYHNHAQVSLQDIVDRHYCLGGEDLMNTVIWKKGTWTQDGLVNRKNLVTAFYEYMNDPHGYAHQSWMAWLEVKKAQGYAYLPVGAEKVDPHRGKTA